MTLGEFRKATEHLTDDALILKECDRHIFCGYRQANVTLLKVTPEKYGRYTVSDHRHTNNLIMGVSLT